RPVGEPETGAIEEFARPFGPLDVGELAAQLLACQQAVVLGGELAGELRRVEGIGLRGRAEQIDARTAFAEDFVGPVQASLGGEGGGKPALLTALTQAGRSEER